MQEPLLFEDSMQVESVVHHEQSVTVDDVHVEQDR